MNRSAAEVHAFAPRGGGAGGRRGGGVVASSSSAATGGACALQLLVLCLAVALTLPLTAPGALASEAVPSDAGRERERDPFVVTYRTGPEEGGALVVEDRPTKLWAEVTWRGDEPLVSTLHLDILKGQAVLNRTRIPVEVPANGQVTFPVEVRNTTGGEVIIQTTAPNTTGPAGRDVVHVATLSVVPPLSVSMMAVAPERTDQTVHVGLDEPLSVRLVVTNPTQIESSARELTLLVQGRGHETERGRDPVLVPSLAPGASHTARIDMGTVRSLLDDQPRRSESFLGTVNVGLVAVFLQEGEPLSAFSFRLDGARVLDARWASLSVRAHAQPASYTTAEHVQVGGPSWLEVTVGNFGNVAQTVVVDVVVRPRSSIYYGPGSSFEETRVLRLDAGERRPLNFTFVPRVAGPMTVETQTSFQGHRSGNYKELPVPSAIQLDTPSSTLEPSVGGSVDWSFNLTGLRELGDVRLRFAAAPQTHRATGDMSFVRFVTSDDFVTVSGAPERVTIQNGSVLHVDARVVAKAAGSYAVVPFAVKDGVFYPADASQVGGEGQAFRVLAEAELPAASIAWFPVGLVLVAAVGQVVWRRRFVR